MVFGFPGGRVHFGIRGRRFFPGFDAIMNHKSFDGMVEPQAT